jgi:hypothetical protein
MPDAKREEPFDRLAAPAPGERYLMRAIHAMAMAMGLLVLRPPAVQPARTGSRKRSSPST